jgi:hypothetical protein
MLPHLSLDNLGRGDVEVNGIHHSLKAHELGVRVRYRASRRGAEVVTSEWHTEFKDFNAFGEALVERLRAFRENDVSVLGSFTFSLSSDQGDTLD